MSAGVRERTRYQEIIVPGLPMSHVHPISVKTNFQPRISAFVGSIVSVESGGPDFTIRPICARGVVGRKKNRAFLGKKKTAQQVYLNAREYDIRKKKTHLLQTCRTSRSAQPKLRHSGLV